MAAKVPKGGENAPNSNEGSSIAAIVLPAVAIAAALAWKFIFADQM